MPKRKHVEGVKHPNWGGARVGGGRPKKAPASSVRIETKLLEEVRKFTRFHGAARELIEAAAKKELLERQAVQDAHLKTVAVDLIERHKKRGWRVPYHLWDAAGLPAPKGEKPDLEYWRGRVPPHLWEIAGLEDAEDAPSIKTRNNEARAVG